MKSIEVETVTLKMKPEESDQICTVCMICNEIIELNTYGIAYRICDKCKKAVIKVRKEMEKNARKYIAISIKHTEYKWKFGIPCTLWGYKRTDDNEERCFAGYTDNVNNAELYAIDDFKNHGYDETICKSEPVKMCPSLCKKYNQYDTVLVLEEDYKAYLRICKGE